jgi:hypothetical protein
MSEKPILFNTEMVRAILEGRKTQTRRKIKLQLQAPCEIRMREDEPFRGQWQLFCENPMLNQAMNSPWGMTVEAPFKMGDILWVRETWARSMAGTYLYRASDTPLLIDRWHPSIHMPREAARLFLRVTDVQAERLQWCGNAQAKQEGCFCCSQFAKLWDETLKPSDRDTYGWAADPWVWVISFQWWPRPDGWPTEIVRCDR